MGSSRVCDGVAARTLDRALIGVLGDAGLPRDNSVLSGARVLGVLDRVVDTTLSPISTTHIYGFYLTLVALRHSGDPYGQETFELLGSSNIFDSANNHGAPQDLSGTPHAYHLGAQVTIMPTYH